MKAWLEKLKGIIKKYPYQIGIGLLALVVLLVYFFKRQAKAVNYPEAAEVPLTADLPVSLPSGPGGTSSPDTSGMGAAESQTQLLLDYMSEVTSAQTAANQSLFKTIQEQTNSFVGQVSQLVNQSIAARNDIVYNPLNTNLAVKPTTTQTFSIDSYAEQLSKLKEQYGATSDPGLQQVIHAEANRVRVEAANKGIDLYALESKAAGQPLTAEQYSWASDYIEPIRQAVQGGVSTVSQVVQSSSPSSSPGPQYVYDNSGNRYERDYSTPDPNYGTPYTDRYVGGK